MDKLRVLPSCNDISKELQAQAFYFIGLFVAIQRGTVRHEVLLGRSPLHVSHNNAAHRGILFARDSNRSPVGIRVFVLVFNIA